WAENVTNEGAVTAPLPEGSSSQTEAPMGNDDLVSLTATYTKLRPVPKDKPDQTAIVKAYRLPPVTLPFWLRPRFATATCLVLLAALLWSTSYAVGLYECR